MGCCSNCGEGCSEEDVTIDGWCARCDDARAEDLRHEAEQVAIAEAA